MSDSNQLAVVESEIIEGPVVAVQYPSTVDYESSIDTGKELSVKYKDLMRIDVDDKVAYEELCKAIKAVVTVRTDCTKDEDIIKKPLNEFRALVIDTGKSIRKNIVELAEDPLKAEKKRVDDIKANRLLELQKTWTKNFNELNLLKDISIYKTTQDLENFCAVIDITSIDEEFYGDYTEDAKASKANILILIETKIQEIKEAEKVRLEQEKVKKEQDEKEARLKREQQALLDQQKKQKIINDEIEAYADASERETKALKEQLAAMQAEKDAVEKEKTEKHFKDMGENDRKNNTKTVITDISGNDHIVSFEPPKIMKIKASINIESNSMHILPSETVEVKIQNNSVATYKTIANIFTSDTSTMGETEHDSIKVVQDEEYEIILKPESNIIATFPNGLGSTIDHENPFDETPQEPQESAYIEDNIKIDAFIDSLIYVIEQAPIDFKHNEYVQAVNRVVESINKANGFLNSIKKD